MKRLLIASILLTGCAPSYYIGNIVEKDPYVRRVTVEITNTHYIVAVAEERDTLEIGDEVKVDKETLKIISWNTNQ
jgi:hypothetical protein